MSRTLQTAAHHVSRQKRTIYLMVSVLFCLVMIFSGIERAGAAGGDLDPLFNPGGLGTDGFGVFGVALQPDGKIIIAGNFASYNGVDVSDDIVRLNTDGTLDLTFNMGGAGIGTNVGGIPSDAHVVAVQPDGKILVGGNFTSYNGDEAASDNIARLNTDGTLDTSFNYGGAGANATVNAIAVQPDGKILVGGNFNIFNGDSDSSEHIVRLNTNGTLDTTFNMGGTGASFGVDAVAVLPDGKIIIGGGFTSYNGNSAASDYIARLNANGTLDTTFNMGGVGANGSLYAVALQPDGKIIIGGIFQSYNGDAAASDYIARLHSNGTLDTTFNYGGAGPNGILTEVALQPDGKIIIAGPFTTYNGDSAASDYIARLNSNGTLDTTFNYGGAGPDAGVTAVAVQPDGKIIIGGAFTSYNGDAAASDHVARLLPAAGEIAFSSATYSVDETAGNATITLTRTGGTDSEVVAKVTLTDGTTTPADYRFTPGALDTSFNMSGTGANGNVYAVAVQPDGKIIIGGQFTSYNGDEAASNNIARLNTDGTLDTSFNYGVAGTSAFVSAIASQPDGKIIIGGGFSHYYNGVKTSNFIIRLNADGTLDTTFNNGGDGANTYVFDVAVQPDGKIIFGGDFDSYNGDAAASDKIARLNTDGTLDTSFNPGGLGANSAVSAIALQPDGKIIIGGRFTHYNGDIAANNKIARLNTDGTLDTTFNMGGTAGANGLLIAAVALQPDGKIIIGGQFTSYDGNTAASDYIARLNANGTLDTTFNMGGVGANNDVNAVAVQPDGKIIIGGFLTEYNGNSAASDHITRLDGDLFVTWPAGDATNKTIQIPIVNDGLNEFPDETLNLSLTVLSGGATLGSPNTATLTILDPNDAPVNSVPAAQSTNENTPLVFSSTNINQISIADLDAGTSPMQVTLTATNGTLTLYRTSGLSFITGDGDADAMMSFTGTITAINAALDGLSFTPTPGYSGAASLEIVTNDQGSTGTGGAQSDTDTINITINEGGLLELSAATYSVNEGAGSIIITVTRALGSNGAATVNYATANGNPPAGATGGASCAAGKDYVTQTGTLSWANGDMANKTFTVTICNDAVFEGNEKLNLTLSNVTGSASLGTPSAAMLTIVDNETQPKISVNDVTKTEGNAGMANANFTVTLSVASTKTVTVNYATSNGTAQAPSDYVAVPLTTLTFTPGQTSKIVPVAIKGDTLDEANETFKITFTGQTNATIADGIGIGTITDNDLPPRLSINNVSLTEGDAGMKAFTFTVSLSAASGQRVSVKYATANGTATAPADYTARPLTTLTFTPGQTSKLVTVMVRGETVLEGNETFFVNLSVPVNATIFDAQGQGTITNDD